MKTRYGTVMNGALTHWAPQPIPGALVPWISVLMALFAINRGLDLIRSRRSTSEINAFVGVVGQMEWGIWIAGAGLLVILSVAPWFSRIIFVIASHAFIAATYAAYAATLSIGWLLSGGSIFDMKTLSVPVGLGLAWAVGSFLWVRRKDTLAMPVAALLAWGMVAGVWVAEAANLSGARFPAVAFAGTVFWLLLTVLAIRGAFWQLAVGMDADFSVHGRRKGDRLVKRQEGE